MKPLRTVLFWCHLIAGASVGLVVLTMAASGVLLTYERQIVLWADTRDFHIAPTTRGASHLTVEALLARVREARPEASVQMMTLRHDPAAPAAMTLGRDGMVYVHPYTGAILGPGSPGVRELFRNVTNCHRWLAVGGDNRATARAVTGASNLVFLFMLCSGIYLWSPRAWTWPQFKNIVWFRRGLPGKARDFNWHHVIGFWSAIPLAVIVSSGVVMSYPWANSLVYRMAGETPPVAGRGQGAGPGPGQVADGDAGRGSARGEGRPAVASEAARSERPTRGSFDGLDALWSRAEQQVSAWRIISLRLPASPDAPLTFTIDRGDGGQPQKRAQLTLDRTTGEIVRWEPFAATTRGRQLRTILRFAHTGEVLGVGGQTVAGLASLGGTVLVYTGLALSCRRFFGWSRRRAVSSVVAPASRPVDQAFEPASAAARRVEALD